MKTSCSLICFVDKQYPPDHSFVGGMLSDVLPKRSGTAVQIVLASPEQGSLAPLRFRRSICLPLLPSYPRRGFRRLEAVVRAYVVGRRLIRRSRRHRRKVVLFVRNDALSLLVAGLLRTNADALIFQSSFPFEDVHDRGSKRLLHRILYRLAGRRVDAILAVSPLALERLTKLLPWASRREWIPLLSDLGPPAFRQRLPTDDECTRFVYAGTHKAPRKLEVVLEGIVEATKQGVNARFTFVGGTAREVELLRAVTGVCELEGRGVVVFRPPIPRSEMAEMMAAFDVGLSIIPPSPIYVESAPTKLAEYMGAGLAVLASNGIPWQELIIRKARAGVLVNFSPTEISEGIRSMSEDRDVLREMMNAATTFASRELTHETYLPALMRLIDETL